MPGQTPRSRGFADRAWLVGEDGGDQAAEMPTEALVELVIDEADEAGDRIRVEQVAGQRFILVRAAADVVQPANVGVHLAVDHRQPFTAAAADDGRKRFVRLQGRFFPNRQAARLQAARLVGRILRHHLARRRSGRVHALVVEDDLHPPPLGVLDGDIVEFEQRLRHPAQRARQADARVDDEAMHAVLLEISDLAADFDSVKLVVPEPEGQDGELGGWVGEGVEGGWHGRVRVVMGVGQSRSDGSLPDVQRL